MENFTKCVPRLPDEIMIEIFRYLPIVDRIAIERVSKSWLGLAVLSWNRQRILNMDSKSLGFGTTFGGASISCRNDSVLQKILRRCGKHLVNIDVSTLRYCALTLISERCPNVIVLHCGCASEKGLYNLSNCQNLQELIIDGTINFERPLHDLFTKARMLRRVTMQNFTGAGECLMALPLKKMITIKVRNISADCAVRVIHQSEKLRELECESVKECVFHSIANACTELTVLELKANLAIWYNDVDSALSRVFERNRNLRSLTLRCFARMTAKCFLSLNERNITKIALISTENIKKEYLKESFGRFHRLSELEFRYINSFKLGRIAECISLCKHLEKLSVNFVRQYSNRNLIKMVSGSKSLEKLDLSHMNDSEIQKSFTEYLSSHAFVLQELTLSRCRGITDSHLENICELKYLTILNVSGNPNLHGTMFGNFKNLRQMNCSYCSSVTNEHLIKLLECASDLTVLDIEGCRKVNNKTIDVAIKVTMQRTQNHILEIRMRSTGVDRDSLKNTSKLLYLNDT